MIGTQRRAPAAAEREVNAALAAAEEAFGRADYETSKGFLRIAGASPATRGTTALLLAKVARIEHDANAWREAAAVASADHPDEAGRLAARALHGLALRRLGDRSAAERELQEVRRRMARSRARDLGHAVYLLALDAWASEDYGLAASTIQRNLDEGWNLAESLALLGWIDVKRERFADAGLRFTAALDSLNESGVVDLRLRGSLIHAAAIVASEVVDLALGRRVRVELETMVWPPSRTVDRANTLACMRFIALLEGDLPRAWLLAREAAATAPAGPYAAIAETNAAATSMLLGDRAGARLQLERAWTIVDDVKWGAADDESRVALTNFAYHGARTMAAEARRAMTLYQSLTAKANRLNALHRDRRVSAFEQMAAARVSESLGERDLAIEQYRRSLALWQALGFVARAALVALDLRRLTGDRRLTTVVKAALKRAPEAWFRRQLAAREGPFDRLTPAERVVLAELLRGKTAKAIARDLGRSAYTIINHTRKVYAAFGVRSRARLLARCAELGVAAEQLGAARAVSITSGRRRKSSPKRRR